MALIIDPDLLNQGTEVTISTAGKTITLNQAGNLSTDGVTLKALYSFFKEEWKNDPALIPFEFPFVPITDESYEMVSGWNFADDASRYLIRTAGWAVKNTSNNTTEEWAGIVGLGSIEADDQLYFDQGSGAVNIQLQGQVNQAVQTLSDPNGDGNFVDGFDRRAQFDLYVREQAQIYGKADLTTIGVTGNLSPIAYRFPITTSADSKVTVSDNDIDTLAPYTGMSITFFNTPQQRTLGGVTYNFGVIVDGNGGTAEQIYQWCQRQLRKNTDIDAGASGQIGNITDQIMIFIGDVIFTQGMTNNQGGGQGVFVDNILLADINRYEFCDNNGDFHSAPFVSVANIDFNGNLENDADAKWWMFYTTNPAGNMGTANAVIVHGADTVTGTDISFTAPDLIGSTTTDFTTAFEVNEYIHVEGTVSNNGYYKIASVTANSMELVEQTISTEAAGSSFTITQALLGDVSAQDFVEVSFDYDANVQGGRTANTDADVTVVAIGLNTGQYVSVTSTIGRSKENSISLVAPLERNYSNPA
jgi:hypothetical protein